METRICHICGETVGAREACPTCTAAVPAWKSPALMTPEERYAELYMWYNPAILEVPFDVMHARIEALLDRPVWTHELTDGARLLAEVLGDKPKPTMEMILEKVAQLVGSDRVMIFDADGSVAEHAKRN